MKKVIILTTILLFLLVPVMRISAAPADDELYSETYGELLYFEDFEDGSTANAYATMGSDAFIWTNGTVVDNPVGEGKAFISTASYLQFKLTGSRTIDSTEVTLSADFLNYDSVASNIPVAFLNSWLDPWNYWTNDQISKTEWTTKSVTITKNVTLVPGDSGNLFFYFGGKGMYFDNIKVYAKYDLGNNIRLFDDGVIIAEVTGSTFTFPDFKTAMKNCWVDSEGTQYFAGDVVNAADCMGKTYYSKAVDFVEVEEVLKLNLSAQAITTDKGTVTIIPEISYINGRAETDFSDITYTIDTVNATINRNADHSITVTGQINGDVTITAHFPERIRNKLKNHEESIETTLTISGQPERIVSSTFKVMMFGNSIRKHPPNESLKWTGNWGMAASSEDKDYAHRFIYYMNEKYGQGVAVLYNNTSSVDSFESAFANKDETADYTESVSTYIKQIKEVNPDIITLQFGDNAKNVTSTAAYKNGIMQFIREIRKVAPDAIIVLSTPFFGGGYHIDGTIAAGEEADVPVALLHKLYTYENWAKSENPDLAAGVGIHPGDRGMDNIAKMFFELADAEIAERNCLEYSTIPTSIEIEGGNLAITAEDGTLNLSAKILPADAPKDVIWTLVSENHGRFATIDANGKLSAVNNGTVTVRATSRYVESLYDEATVTISGQAAPFTVTYNGNASDAVVPAPNTWAKKGFRLDNPEAFASRPGYKFVGWALTADGEAVDSLTNATTDTTVYAKWTIAESWDFERTGYLEDFTFENAFHLKVLDGYLTATATDTSDVNILKIKSPTLMLNSADYSCLKIKMRNTEKASDTVLKLTVTAGGTKTEFSKAVTSVNYVEYLFDLSALSGTITGFEITPTNVDCTLYIESIEFVKKGVGEYTAKPAAFSERLGNLVYFDNFSGNDFGNTANIEVLGPGTKKAIILGKYAVLNDGTTLGHAQMSGLLIKAADGETFRYNDGRVMNGTFNFEFEIYNGTASNAKFYYCVNKNPGGWDSWSNLYTAWGGVTVTPGTWVTRSTAFDPKYATVAYLNSAKLGENVAIGSVAVYFMPKIYATLIVDDNKTLVDLNELEQYTLPVVDGYNKYIDAEKNVYNAGQTYAVADIIGKTFTAEYVEDETVVKYTVSFNDSDFNSQTIIEGNCATNPGKVNKTGYTFLYWSLTEGGEEYNFSTPVTSDITLYAVFEKIEQPKGTYTAKPAVFSESYGNLVYFDNFSGEDFGNVADIVVVGPGVKSAEFLGKIARLNDGTTLGHAQMSGLLIKAANGESFKYKDGRNMNGTFYLSYEVYNSAAKECGFFYCRDINTGGWSSWAGLYTAWNKKVAAAGTWTTIATTETSTSKAIFGYLNAESFGESTAIASVSLYFMPNNKATFVAGGNKTIMDLEGLDTVTMPNPGEGFNAWTDGNGNIYTEGQTVNSANIKNATLTAFFDTTAPYSIDSISLLDADFNAITSIPDESFFVEVEVTNVNYDNRAIVLVATYDNDGRMIDIDFLYANPLKEQTVTFGAQVNNKTGNVAKVKAFIIGDLKKFDALTEAVEITKSK